MKYDGFLISILLASLATVIAVNHASVSAEDRLTPHSEPAKFQAKLDELNKLIEKSPCSLDYAARSNLYVIWHKPVEAFASINKAIELDSKDASYYAYRGLINLKLSKDDNAIADIQKAHSMGHKNSKTLGYLSFLQMQKKNFLDAKVNAVEALKKNPNNYTALFVKGSIENIDGKYQQAVEDLSSAIGVRADVPDFFTERAKSWQNLGQSIKASDDLAKAKKLAAHLFD